MLKELQGTITKRSYLRQNPDLQLVLKYGLDPFITFGINRTKAIGQGEGVINDITWAILDNLSTLKGITKEVKQDIETYITTLTYEEGELFKAILGKKLRLGIAAKEINKVWPKLIDQHDVMLAQQIDWSRASFPCLISPKLDGLRAIYRNGQFRTRNGKAIVGIDHILNRLRGAPVLDGELIVPGQTFYTSSGNIRSYRDSPDALYYVFEVPYYNSNELQRRLHEAVKYMTTHIHIVPHVPVYNKEEALKLYQEYRNEGLEGAILKPFFYSYQDKRSYDWMKIKPKETIDLKIVSIYEGEGKYENNLGGVVVNYNGVFVSVGSGFSDDQRIAIYTDPNSYIGKYIELDYHEVTPDGSLREPRFKKFRWDK